MKTLRPFQGFLLAGYEAAANQWTFDPGDPRIFEGNFLRNLGRIVLYTRLFRLASASSSFADPKGSHFNNHLLAHGSRVDGMREHGLGSNSKTPAFRTKAILWLLGARLNRPQLGIGRFDS